MIDVHKCCFYTYYTFIVYIGCSNFFCNIIRMALTRNKKNYSDGDLQCNKLKEFFQNRKKNKNKKKTIQKLDDL